jgi:hypothetical protein
MKTIFGYPLLVFSFFVLQSCADGKKSDTETSAPNYKAPFDTSYTIEEYNNTKGYWENGEIITNWNCPDAVRDFPPIDMNSWSKIPAVNGRLPTYLETKNGTAIHHYGEVTTTKVRPYDMFLPKLAYHLDRSSQRKELVVVIQIVQTPKDTIVGFRYLTGGCGGSLFRDFHFLSEEEVVRATSK